MKAKGIPMQKRNFKIGIELTDKQWAVIKPLLREPQNVGKGGPKPIPNRPCLEGILWVLRSGARWKDMPSHFPSYATCWRRLVQWQEEDVLIDIWQKLLGTLDEQGRLKWDEIFADGTFVPAKKGAPVSVKRNAAREQKLWWWLMVRAYLSACSLLPRRPTK